MKLRFKFNGKVIEKEVRNLLHFEVQKSTRANIFRNKKKYTRKQKHKNKKEKDNYEGLFYYTVWVGLH